MKKRMPTICLLAFLVALAVGVPALRIAFAHASSASNISSNTNNITATITPVSSSGPISSLEYVPACASVSAGYARCMAMVSTTTVQPTFATPVVNSNVSTAAGGATHTAFAPGSAAPYSPTALHNAYNLPNTTNSTQTIALIDAFDDPNAESDLATYRSMFGLPACSTANGCFKKVNEMGGTVYPTANTSWGVETSLDLDMASAICQNCHILLVEATSASFADLGASVNEAVTLGANEVSNSYGSPETTGEDAICNSFYNHPGIAVTASSGDAGLGVNVPAVCPAVTSVGGTTLPVSGTETDWNTSATVGAGGGCSTLIPIPIPEVPTVTNCAMRSVADVSAVADPNTGVFVFDTFGQGGGLQIGGTSASSPIIAALFALAGGTAGDATSALVPWSKHNANCLNVVGGVPYAFQTGLGSPAGITCF